MNVTGTLREAVQDASYDWTREMPPFKRVITWAAYLIQGYALYAGVTHSLAWPWMWPRGMWLYASVGLLYLVGAWLLNGMLTSELRRKTQMESEQIAARNIQQTLQPKTVEPLPGYDVELFSQPHRSVGGDYFDLIPLSTDLTLIALADVSGKGMPAALLSANLQALVRALASIDADPLQLATKINQHLSRYTPDDRFVTAVFIMLNRETGCLTYVNAGHNPPLVFGGPSPTRLEATGVPLGMFAEARYEARSSAILPGGALLAYTDGLTDAIPADEPEERICDLLAAGPHRAIADVRSLVDPKLIHDDVTIMLVRRAHPHVVR